MTTKQQQTHSSNDEFSFEKEYLNAMKLIIQLFAYIKIKETPLSQYEHILNIISTQTHKVKICVMPLLMNFYILHLEKYPSIANLVWQYILNETNHSLQIGHILILNIISCKHSYKKRIEMKKLKDLIIQIISSFKYKEEILSSQNDNNKIYSSLFNVYNSCEEFVEKNLIKLTNLKDYITAQGKIKWNNIMLNKRKNDQVKLQSQSQQWIRYIAEISFINDLVSISDILRYVEITERNNTLKDFLLYINKEYLPSNLYDILENKEIDYSGMKLLLRIDEKFSYVINTKERVPCNLVFEYLVPYDINDNDDNNGINRTRKRIINSDLNNPQEEKRNTFCERASLVLPKIRAVNNLGGAIVTNPNKSSSAQKSDSPIISSVREFSMNINNAQPSGGFSNMFSCFSNNNNNNNTISSTFRKNDSNYNTEYNKQSNEEIEKEFNLDDIELTIPSTASDINNERDEQHLPPNSVGVFGKYTFAQVTQKVLKTSKYNKMSKYKNKPREVISSIVKGADELRQDYFVNHIMMLFNSIFILNEPNLNIFVLPNMVFSNGSGGLIQTVINSASLNKINKINFSLTTNDINTNNNGGYSPSSTYEESIVDSDYSNFKKYFVFKYGIGSIEYETALYNFISSLSGYSLLCYFLEIKDRNNGNILLDEYGHIYHIDFGFLLNKTPGNIKFEKAPFKLTTDFIEILGGTTSKYFLQYQKLFYRGFNAIRKEEKFLYSIIEMFCRLFGDLTTFKDRDTILKRLKDKFMLDKKEEKEIVKACNDLILESMNNWTTNAYDQVQRFCVGIN